MEEERRDLLDLSFHETEVKLAKKMIDTLRTSMEFLYYLMDHRDTPAFTMILLSTENLKLNTLLPLWKRQSDLLFELDEEKNIYVLICQSTDTKGAKKFVDILLSNISVYKSSKTYCVGTELYSTENSIQDVVFKLVEQYMITKRDNDANKIVFTRVMKDSRLFENNVIYNDA